jgi:hypothetical protein
MDHKRPVVGDQDNTEFVIPELDAHHASPGYDAGSDPISHEGAKRFPRRRADNEVPKETLAARIAKGPVGKR